MKTSESINEIAAALAKAQAAFPKLLKDQTAKIDSSKGGYTYKYSDLGALFEAIRKPLADNGLAVVQPIVTENGHHELVTLLLHTSGQFIESRMRLADYERPQEFGSEITYYRRYALGALVGIASEVDDDGAAAQGGRKLPGHYRQTPPPTLAQPPAPTTDKDVAEAFGTKEGDTESDRPFLVEGCKRKVEEYKFTAKERQELKSVWLGGQAADLALLKHLHALYLFLGDPQAVKDWRAEFAKASA